MQSCTYTDAPATPLQPSLAKSKQSGHAWPTEKKDAPPPGCGPAGWLALVRGLIDPSRPYFFLLPLSSVGTSGLILPGGTKEGNTKAQTRQG